jgi:hypothetical protein
VLIPIGLISKYFVFLLDMDVLDLGPAHPEIIVRDEAVALKGSVVAMHRQEVEGPEVHTETGR